MRASQSLVNNIDSLQPLQWLMTRRGRHITLTQESTLKKQSVMRIKSFLNMITRIHSNSWAKVTVWAIYRSSPSRNSSSEWLTFLSLNWLWSRNSLPTRRTICIGGLLSDAHGAIYSIKQLRTTRAIAYPPASSFSGWYFPSHHSFRRFCQRVSRQMSISTRTNNCMMTGWRSRTSTL